MSLNSYPKSCVSKYFKEVSISRHKTSMFVFPSLKFNRELKSLSWLILAVTEN